MPDPDMLWQKESVPGYFVSEVPKMQIVFRGKRNRGRPIHLFSTYCLWERNILDFEGGVCGAGRHIKKNNG